VLFVVDRALLVAVAHELPAGVLARLRDARVIDAHSRVDRDGGLYLELLVEGVEAPEADAHAVLVPGPVRHVGQQRDSGRRRQHLPRHRPADVPDLEVDYRPDDDAVGARKLRLRPVDDSRVRDALARKGHFFFLAFARRGFALTFTVFAAVSGSASLSMRIALPK